jgi:hypothetical protein
MLRNNDTEEIYLAGWEESKWIVMSSFFFTVPSIYAFIQEKYNLSLLLLGTSLVSANYWRKATYSWRRNLDLVFAKVSFTVFVYNGVIHVRTLPLAVSGYTGLCLLCFMYYLSNVLWKLKNGQWVTFHVSFHFLMMCEQLLILYSMM